MIVYDYEDNSVVERILTDDDKSKVMDDIVQKWNTWSVGISKLKKHHDTMKGKTTPKVCSPDDKDWHSKIELNRPYQYRSKLFGMLYETFYDKISSYLKMGKVNYDKVYATALTIENKKELLVSINDILDYGEVVSSAELKKTYKREVYPITEIVNFNQEDIISITNDSFIARVETGSEISYVRINPENFAYDPLVVPNTKDFDTCDKIVKQWKSKQEILTNRNYEITREDLDQIVGNQSTPNQQSSDKSDKDVIYRSNQVEVLTYYGNFIIEGKYYNDYIAVVIGRAKLVYFQPRNLFTPGIYFYPYGASGNGARGISPLYYILDLCALEQKTLNDSVDFIQLQKNPPKYAPVGFFEEETTKLEPGKHITYKPGMQDPTAIIPITFNAQPLMVFEAATAQLTEEIAGIDNGKLSEKSEALTQEEVKRIAVNENLIPNMIISGIMLNVVSKYLTDCLEIIDGAEQNEILVKTAWEYANEQMQMGNVVGILKEIGASDPTMVKLSESARKTLETMGVNPDEYLNDGRSSQILAATAGLSENVLQELFQIAQQLQVKENNKTKARKMMGQIQDSEYKSALKEAYKNTGQLPRSVIVPNGQGLMEVPVEAVTPDAQVDNKSGVSA